MSRHAALRIVAWAGALAVLGGVFMLYLQPEFRVALSEQIWLCFQ